MKYVFFDIDGTIRGKSREITKRNKEAICKLRENGHKAFLCTGRAPVSITQDILDVGFDGVISAAGSFIQIDGEYIYEKHVLRDHMSVAKINDWLYANMGSNSAYIYMHCHQDKEDIT